MLSTVRIAVVEKGVNAYEKDNNIVIISNSYLTNLLVANNCVGRLTGQSGSRLRLFA